MRLACAAFPDQHHWLGAFDVASVSQCSNLSRVDLRRLVEVELLQSFEARQIGPLQPVTDRMPVALFHLHRQQCFQITDVILFLAHRLFRQGRKVSADHWHAHRLAVLPHTGLLQRRRLLAHWISSVSSPLSSESYSAITGSGLSNCANSSFRTSS